MKKIIVILLLLPYGVHAQRKSNLSDDKNILKWNTLGLTSSTISLQAERLLSPNTSITANINVMPKRNLPFRGVIDGFVKNDNANDVLDGVKINIYSVAPELRIYFKNKTFTGVYIAPFLRYDHISISFPVEYKYNDATQRVIVSGNVDAFSGGLAFGGQWQILPKWYLDITLIGLSYGSANGELSGRQPINDEEQIEVINAIEDVQFPLVDYTYNVHNQGVNVNIKGPWANLKLALAVGYRF